jgi:transcriptional antiterminator RfaH
MTNWYAIYSRHHHEQKVTNQLSKMGLDNYLPMTMSLRYWKDRKKWLEMPVFPCYLFVKCELENVLYYINRMPGVVSIVGSPQPEVIPEYQIAGIQRVLSFDPDCENVPGMIAGDDILIVRGPLKGVRGTLLEKRGMNLLVVRIELINQGLSTIVNIKDVIKYSPAGLLPCSVINYEAKS